MKRICTISLAVLTLAVTACGGSGGESDESAQDRAVERYAELLEGVGAENVDDFSACVLPVLKDTSGLSWDDIATRLDNSSTFEDSEEQFDDVPEPDENGQATLLACFAELSEDDVQKIILGETVAADAPEVSQSVAEIAEGWANNLREGGYFDGSRGDKTDEEIQIWTECTMAALLNAGFSEDELYDHFVRGAWREDIFDARVDGPESSQCFTEFMFGPPLELPDGDLFELAVTAYASNNLKSLDFPPSRIENIARCALTKLRDGGISDEDIWRYAVWDYSSGATGRVADAIDAGAIDDDWDCYEE